MRIQTIKAKQINPEFYNKKTFEAFLLMANYLIDFFASIKDNPLIL